MAYYKKVLRPGEQVLFLGRLHWIVYAPGLLAAVLGLIALVSVAVSDDRAKPFFGVAGLILLILALVMLLSHWLQRVTTEIVVTDHRVIYKTGLIGRRTMEMNTSKIETVDVFQGIMGRVFGFGTVLIRGTGSTFEPLSKIASPLSLRNAILVG